MDLTQWKEAKKRNNLTIAEIAKRAELPKGTVQNIFAGYIPNPRIDTVRAIERALGLDSPFTPEEQAAGIFPTARMTVTPEEDDLLTLYREIGEKKGSEAQQLGQRLLEQILKA